MNHSPLHHHLSELGARFEECDGWRVPRFAQKGLGHGVGMIDASHRLRIRAEGPDAAKTVKGAKLRPGEGASRKIGRVFCSRPDLFFVLAATGVPKVARKSLVDSREMTHGTSEIWVTGPQARKLLSRVCGLDFHSQAFLDRSLKTSSVAKTKQHLFRWDQGSTPAFALVGRASFAVYLWRTLTEAAQDLDLRLLDSEVLS